MTIQPVVRPVMLLLLVGLLSACAGVTRVPLDKTASANIARTESNLLIPADELIVRAKPSSVSLAMGGGLIPALIDSSITSSRQTELEAISNPFYAQVEHIDFRGTFSDSFKAAINDQKVFPGLNLTVKTTGLSQTMLEEKRSKLAADEAYMGLRIWYEFTADTRSVMVGAVASVVSPAKKENLYKNELIYISKPVEGENPLAVWGENNGKRLAQEFSESAAQIAGMLKQDLEAPANEELFAGLAKQEKIKLTFPTFMPVTISGYVVEQGDLRKTVRAESGALFSVSR